MKKNILKTTKSIAIAAAICAGLALGALSAVSGSAEQPIIATRPNFIDGVY